MSNRIFIHATTFLLALITRGNGKSQNMGDLLQVLGKLKYLRTLVIKTVFTSNYGKIVFICEEKNYQTVVAKIKTERSEKLSVLCRRH